MKYSMRPAKKLRHRLSAAFKRTSSGLCCLCYLCGVNGMILASETPGFFSEVSVQPINLNFSVVEKSNTQAPAQVAGNESTVLHNVAVGYAHTWQTSSSDALWLLEPGLTLSHADLQGGHVGSVGVQLHAARGYDVQPGWLIAGGIVAGLDYATVTLNNVSSNTINADGYGLNMQARATSRWAMSAHWHIGAFLGWNYEWYDVSDDNFDFELDGQGFIWGFDLTYR